MTEHHEHNSIKDHLTLAKELRSILEGYRALKGKNLPLKKLADYCGVNPADFSLTSKKGEEIQNLRLFGFDTEKLNRILKRLEEIDGILKGQHSLEEKISLIEAELEPPKTEEQTQADMPNPEPIGNEGNVELADEAQNAKAPYPAPIGNDGNVELVDEAQNAKAPLPEQVTSDTDEKAKTKKHSGLWPVLLFLSGALSALSIYFLLIDSSSTKPNLTRVVLLLPMDKAEFTIENQWIGLLGVYGEYTKESPFYKKFDLKYIDTKNDKKEAWEAMQWEINTMGTRYFVVTLSEMSIFLASKLKSDPAYKSKGVIMLATATSSAMFPCEKNFLYRFYIRNNEQIQALYDNYKTNKNPNGETVLYYIDDASGIDSQDKLNALMGRQLTAKPIGKVGGNFDFSNIAFEKNGNYFISSHGAILNELIKRANEKCDNCKFFATSTLATYNYDSLQSLVKNNKVYVAKPAVLEGSKSNTVSFLVKESLMLFLAAIEKTNAQGDFHENWKQAVEDRDTLEGWKNEPISFDNDSLDLIVPVFVELLQSGSNK